MKLRMCNCHMCKYGRKKRWGHAIVKFTKRAGKRKAKAMIRAGRWDDAPTSISVPYTD